MNIKSNGYIMKIFYKIIQVELIFSLSFGMSGSFVSHAREADPQAAVLSPVVISAINHLDFDLMVDAYSIYLPLVIKPLPDGPLGWNTIHSPTSANLEALEFVSPTDGWVVGTLGTILHWNGTSWSIFSSPTSADLNGIDMLDASTGWAVGRGGTIISWNGTIWSSVTSPVSIDLEDVRVLSVNNAWAVGADGTLLLWDGIVWTSVSSPTTYDLYALDFISSTDGWAVGGKWNTGIGWYEAAYLHWNGSSWTNYSPVHVLDLLFDVDMVSSTYSIAVGINNAKSFWNGTYWNSSFSNPFMMYYYGVDFLTADDGWAVGWVNQESNIQHWDGAGWSRVTSPVETRLNDVYMLDAENGWAVGDAGVILSFSR